MADLLNYRKEDSDMNYNINEQKLGFDRVLPWEGQVPALVKEGEHYFLQVKAPEAENVTFTMNEEEFPCTREDDGIWRMEYTLRTGIQYVQLKIDDVEVVTPLLPITYGYSRPYNYVALEMKNEEFYQVKDVPHGSVRREYFFSKVTGEWESCMVYTPYCYEEETEREFPVLYLQHGHGENEIGWTASGKVNFILDNLIAEKKAVPMVIVMSNGMVQTVTEKGERIVDFKLLENQLLTDIIQGSPLDMVDRGTSENEHMKILDDAKVFNKTFDVYFRAMGDKDPFWENFAHDDQILNEKGIDQIRNVYPGAHDWNVWRMCIHDFAQLIFK